MGEIEIREVDAAATRPLRQQVLRPHQRAEDLVFAGDEAPLRFHVAAFDGARVVGVASIVPEALAGHPSEGAWRVRGMATVPELRGRGVGARLLAACLGHARKQGGRLAWCHARSTALGFYEKAGFAREGGEFELPAIGPHWVMVRSLAGPADER